MDEQQYEYRTGRTEPRRKHNGLIAILLILVIFLAGMVSALGLMNIRLFRMLEDTRVETPLSFAEAQDETLATDGVNFAGMNIQEVTAAYQAMHQLPAGLYIASVQEGSMGAQLGIQVGDVLVSLSGTEVSTLEELQGILDRNEALLSLTVCRNGEHLDYILEVN